MFSDKHAIVEQFERKSIRVIKHHTIQMFTTTIRMLQNSKENTTSITNALNFIQDYINEILKQTAQIEQILKITPYPTNALETETSFKEITLNITNALEFNPKIFSDKHAIEQFKEKSIPSIEHHSIEMFTQAIRFLHKKKNNTPRITNTLKTLQDYINETLTKIEQMEEILKNMPDTTNAPKSDATNAPKNVPDRMNVIYTSFEQKTGADSPTNNN